MRKNDLSDRWVAVLKECALSSSITQWTTLDPPNFDAEQTCLYVEIQSLNVVIRAEHSKANEFSVSASSLDAERRHGAIKEVGAWIQIATDITGAQRQETLVRLCLTTFLLSAQANLQLERFELMLRAIADDFYGGIV
ncbi:hypothetical protein G3576_30225 [Roseomonas stagni]|uniref:Uncharacterized protein n=1 Tax=Falsiroseomonas algicola TaxID=2716930 RepID=A0A6M1LUX9_9PROT|nr:hypothetical protein [Falsiroseomonas algicola]NGM24305.1 hypothetical protein [Falsiroseomonas algicola]